MKKNLIPQKWLATAFTGLALAFSAGTSWAVPDQTLGTFESALNGTFQWGRGWGGLTSVEWNDSGNPDGCLVARGLLESTNSDTPVCIYVTIGNGSNPWYHPSPTFDLSQYKSIEFDIKWNNDPANIPLNDFNYPKGDPESWADNGLQIGAVGIDNGNNIVLVNTPIPDTAAGAWAHVSIPIDATKLGLGEVYGLWIRKWICNPPTNPGDWQTGHVVTNSGNYEFYLDNVVLIGGDVLPPPELSLATTTPGMNFIAASGGQWDRQTIRTATNLYSWIGASAPVSYAVTLAKLGEQANPGYTFVAYLSPGTPNPTRPDCDWHETNVLRIAIANNADGSAWASLMYKTNAPESNGAMYSADGDLGGVWSATPAGTWTVTFDQNTNVTITSASGATLVTNIPQSVIDIFSQTPGMTLSVGGLPGDPGRLGQSSVVTRVAISAGANVVDSDFLTQPMNTNDWQIAAASANFGVQQVSTNAAFWLNWTLPANGFLAQTKSLLTSGSWADLSLPGYDVAGYHHVLLNKSDLPGVNSGFFRLIKPVATKLQILLPGETNAPGTVTGKIGTPDMAVILADYFAVIVNAVDDNFHIITSATPTVHFTSSDVSASLPPDGTLSRGTFTSAIATYLFTPGNQTITVQDTATTNPLASGTSSTIRMP